MKGMSDFTIFLFVGSGCLGLNHCVRVADNREGDWHGDQKVNAKLEDELALNIYNALVWTNKSQTAMIDFYDAYARDTTLWKDTDLPDVTYFFNTKDKGANGWTEIKYEENNPEAGALPFPRKKQSDFGVNEDTVDTVFNNDIKSTRQILAEAVRDKNAHHTKILWAGIVNPVGGIRGVSPYEFVFKQDRKWITGENNMRTDAEIGFYNQVKCGKAEAGCDKSFIKKGNAKKMFLNNKGRGKNGKFESWAGAGVSQKGEEIPALTNFWNSELWSLWTVSEKRCETMKEQCYEIDKSDTEELRCGAMTAACDASARAKPTNSPSKIAMSPDITSDQYRAFLKCKVPFVAGVSGSILEQLAFVAYKGKDITDELILSLMAVLNLAGHHSLGEAWTGSYGYVQLWAQKKNKVADIKMLKVQPPLLADLTGCGCDKDDCDEEGRFLNETRAVLNSLAGTGVA